MQAPYLEKYAFGGIGRPPMGQTRTLQSGTGCIGCIAGLLRIRDGIKMEDEVIEVFHDGKTPVRRAGVSCVGGRKEIVQMIVTLK